MIKRGTYLFFLFGILPMGLRAQGFNKNVEDGFGGGLGSVIQIGNTYFADGVVFQGSFRKKKLFAFNEDGDTLFTKTYGLDSCDYATCVGKSLLKHNDVIYSIGNRYEGSISYPHIMATNINGDSLWMKDLLPYDSAVIQSVQMDEQGDLLVCGTISLPPSLIGQALLIKIDTLGNIKWGKYYGGVGDEQFYSIDTTLGGGYILAGYTKSYGSGLRDVYVVKTDTAGTFQWHKYFGSAESDVGWVKSLKDSTYYIYGALNSTTVEPDAAVWKLNKNGDIAWTKTYDYSGLGYWEELSCMIVNEEEGYFVVGGLLIDGPTIGTDPQGYLVKCDTSGNVIWKRKYNKSTNDNYITDLILTDDNYILCSGYLFPDLTTVMTQDGWLLKLDSLGCVVSGCAIGVDELPISDFEFRIYPNPTSGQFNLEFLGNELDGHVIVRDAMGRLILEKDITQTTTTIDLPNQVKGLYFITVNDEEKSSTLKLIIE